jgi:ATP-dependent Clp protease ATP-binding subunit ClpA
MGSWLTKVAAAVHERVVGQDEAVEGLLIARKGCSR